MVTLISVLADSIKSKAIPFPSHVENYEDTLIWAVKIRNLHTYEQNSHIYPEKSHENFYSDDILDDLSNIVAADLEVHELGKVGEISNVYLYGYKVIDGSDNVDYGQKWKFVDLHNYHKNVLKEEFMQRAQDVMEKKLNAHDNVVWHSRQRVISRQKRQLKFDDPYFKQQWHLVNHVHRKMDINVTGVWERNVTGRGITVAVVDDGLEWTNPDLRDNYNVAGSWDLNADDPDPMPSSRLSSNHHGTRCAGEIAAVRNSICGVGVAYDAKVSGVRVLDGPMTDSLEASAFNKNLQINDVYSCSWGPDDDGKTVDGPHILAQAAMRYGINFGRGGYGNIYVVASGNGGRFGDNCNYDGYANSLYTVTVGAVDETGHMPFYAEECASMLAVTFSSGSTLSQRSIVTTDWMKHGGIGCTEHHTGTSAAAPIAAAMIALMLQVRPCLTWRDVQFIIAMTAQKVDVNLADWQKNGAGLFHSHKHGFGLMRAWRLVNAAKIWTMVPWLTSVSYDSGDVHIEIPKSTPLKITHTVTEEDIRGFNLVTLEHVQMTLTVDHPCRGCLEILLYCPHGTKSVIGVPRKPDNSTSGFSGWTFSSVRCWGENPVGDWRLIITDTDSSSHGSGYLKKWKLKLYGSPMSPEEFQARRKAISHAMSGEFLNDTFSLPCQEPPVKAKPDVPMSEKTLKILALISVFCLVMAVYETMEYSLCYKEEKKEHSRRKGLMKNAYRTADRNSSRVGAHDASETRALLQEEDEIPLDIISSNQSHSSSTSDRDNLNPCFDTRWSSFSENDMQQISDLGDEEDEVLFTRQRSDASVICDRQQQDTPLYANLTNHIASSSTANAK